MVHLAFDVVALINSCSAPIESIALWGTTLYAGCNDGALREFVPSGSGEPYQLKETKIGFARKAITQLDVSFSKRFLFFLSDGIGVRHLPELDPLAPTLNNKTRGANLYSWNEERGLLCVAVRKKLLIYRYDGRQEFVEVREVSLPDTVKTMGWSGDLIFIGLPARRDYCTVNSTTGLLTEIASSGRVAAPLLSVLPGGEVLLAKDNICVFVDRGGKSSRPGDAFSWSEAPLGLVVHSPLVLGKLKRYVEVRSLWPGHALIQTIPLPALSILAASSGGILAVSGREAWHIQPVPVEKQVLQLVKLHRLLDALAFCDLLPPEDASLRASLQDSIHMRYGMELFDNEHYEEAFAHLGLSSVHLPQLLTLFPSIQLPAAASQLEKSGRPYEAEEAALWAEQREVLSGGEVARGLGALVVYLSQKRVPAALGQPAYAATIDTALLQALLALDSASSAVQVAAYRAAFDSAVKLGGDLGQQGVLLQLLSSPNCCDASVCVPLLLAAGKQEEAVVLYRSRGLHREALAVLRGEGMAPSTTVAYLEGLGGEHSDVVLEGSEWVLEQDPDLGLSLLRSFQPPLAVDLVLHKLKAHAPALRTAYLEHLLAPAAQPTAAPPGLHDELVQLHLDAVLAEYRAQAGEGRWEEDGCSQARQKLLGALEHSTAYAPSTLLSQLPLTGLYQERALLLGRLQLHLPLLVVQARKLGAFEACLTYCDKTAEKDSHLYLTLLQVYLDPAAAILAYSAACASSPPEVHEMGFSSDVLLQPALHLLTHRWAHIPWEDAAKVVPEDTPLQGLLGYLDPTFRHASEGRRYLAVVKSLRRAEHLGVRTQVVGGRRRRVVMTGEGVCGICGKRIGTSVFAVTSQHAVVHFVCQQQRNHTEP